MELTCDTVKTAIYRALWTNGGPISAEDTVDGQDYVLVRRDAFDALAALLEVAE